MKHLKNKKISAKNFAFFAKFSLALALGFSISGCSSSSNNQPEIRIVDLDGKPHNVVTKIPDFNAEALAKQGQQSQSNKIFRPQNQPISYGEVIEQTLKVPQNPNSNYTQKAVAQQNSEISTTKEIESQTTNSQNSVQVLSDNSKTEQSSTSATKEVIFDLSKPSEDKLEKNSDKSNETERKLLFKGKKISSKAKVASNVKGYFVQVGSFSNQESAQFELEKMKNFHGGIIEKTSDAKSLYRALLGPFKSKEAALKTLKEVTDSGHEAVIKRNK